MDIINIKEIINQDFKNSLNYEFKIKDKKCYVTINKLDYLIRQRIEKLKLMSVINVYEYDEEGRLKKVESRFNEDYIKNEEEILRLLLTALDDKKHNLSNGIMTIQDWLEFGKYFNKEFENIVEAIMDFNGLTKKKI